MKTGEYSPDKIFRLVSVFEGAEAIYIEKGIAKVRVSDIIPDLSSRVIYCKVENLLCPSLTVLLRGKCWPISAGYLTRFSKFHWVMGYGGWSMYAEPSLVRRAEEFAAALPDAMNDHERYGEILDCIYSEEDFTATSERIFSDPD